MEKLMLASDRVPALVDSLLAARRSGASALTDAEIGGAITAEDAYRVQAMVVAALGPVGGFKVANKPDAPRIMAPILRSDIYRSPARLVCPRDEDIGIELEIGFRIDEPLPPSDAPDRPAQVARCLSAVPVIEIVRTRLSSSASAMLKLADNQINGGLVVGAPLRDWRPQDLHQVQARLTLGDERTLDGAARVPGGNAFDNFLVLEDMVGNHCGGLHPGCVVITGSLNGLPYVRPGLAIRGEIAGLGSVSLDLDRIG